MAWLATGVLIGIAFGLFPTTQEGARRLAIHMGVVTYAWLNALAVYISFTLTNWFSRLVLGRPVLSTEDSILSKWLKRFTTWRGVKSRPLLDFVPAGDSFGRLLRLLSGGLLLWGL